MKDRVSDFYISNPIFLGIELEFYSKYIPVINSDNFKIVKESGNNQYELISDTYSDIEKIIKDSQEIKDYLLSQDIKFDAILSPSEPSNGMHINFSFQNKDFFSNNLEYIIGGLMEYTKNYIYIFAPHKIDQNRYKFDNKSIHDIHSPKTLSWGYNNRSTAFRVVKSSKNGIERIENRLPSSNASISDSIYATLDSIYQGICNKILPPNPTYGIASDSQYKNIPLIDL